jgi:hypothetical protein
MRAREALRDRFALPRRGGRRRCHSLLARRRELEEILIVVVAILACDGILELAHPASQRAAHLGQTLGPEDEQRHEEEERDFPDPNSERHEFSLATFVGDRGSRR